MATPRAKEAQQMATRVVGGLAGSEVACGWRAGGVEAQAFMSCVGVVRGAEGARVTAIGMEYQCAEVRTAPPRQTASSRNFCGMAASMGSAAIRHGVVKLCAACAL